MFSRNKNTDATGAKGAAEEDLHALGGGLEDAGRGSKASLSAVSHARSVSVEELQALYEDMRGATYALSVYNAKEAFAQHDYGRSLALLEGAYEQFERGTQRVRRAEYLKPEGKELLSTKEFRKRSSQQEKALRIQHRFDAVLPALRRLLNAASADRPGPEQPVFQEATDETAITKLPSVAHLHQAVLAAFLRATSLPEKRAVLVAHYTLVPVLNVADVQQNTLYYVVSGDDGYVVRTSTTQAVTPRIHLRDATGSRRLRPIETGLFLKLGSRGAVERLELSP